MGRNTKDTIEMATSDRKVIFSLSATAIILFSCIFSVKSFKLSHPNDTKSYTPHWEPLCGHQYLFSEEKVDWNAAREMCQLLGGYIVRIENRHENNCILVYAQNNGLHYWWWTSGNDIETEGYYVMEDGTEMEWMQQYADNSQRGANNDAILLGTQDNENAGSWVDNPITGYNQVYICEKDDD